MQPHRLPRNLFAGLATITHSPRGLLCVRKSWAIRNGHEGPPCRSLFELSSELLPDRARCVFASTTPPRSADRCLGKRRTPPEQRSERSSSPRCSDRFSSIKHHFDIRCHPLFYRPYLYYNYRNRHRIYTEASLFFITRLVTGDFGMRGTVFISLPLRFISL